MSSSKYNIRLASFIKTSFALNELNSEDMELSLENSFNFEMAIHGNTFLNRQKVSNYGSRVLIESLSTLHFNLVKWLELV